jgi:hypothetical protein
MAASHAFAQPIQDWAKDLKDLQPQCEKTDRRSHVTMEAAMRRRRFLILTSETQTGTEMIDPSSDIRPK